MANQQKKQAVEAIAESIYQLLDEKCLRVTVTLEEGKIKVTKTPVGKNKNLEKRITEIIERFGIHAKKKGYKYLRDAIRIAYEEPDYMDDCFTRLMYHKLAKKYNTTPWAAERAIRWAVETSWNVGDVELKNQLFGFSLEPNKQRPTNKEVVMKIVDYLHINE